MVHPTYRKQVEIRRMILSYLEESKERRTWTQLYEKAKHDGISKATLSRYLKDFERTGLVKREIESTRRPPRSYYSFKDPDDRGVVYAVIPSLPLEKARKILLSYARAVTTLSPPRNAPKVPDLLLHLLAIGDEVIRQFHSASTIKPFNVEVARERLRSRLTYMAEYHSSPEVADRLLSALSENVDAYGKAFPALSMHLAITIAGIPVNEQFPKWWNVPPEAYGSAYRALKQGLAKVDWKTKEGQEQMAKLYKEWQARVTQAAKTSNPRAS